MCRFMKLSLRGEYALRALMVLGDNYSAEVVRIHRISKQQGIPQRFLEQILNDLKAGGFVESKRGIAGGYRLAKPPQQLTLAPVIRQIEGTLLPEPASGKQSAKAGFEANDAQRAIGTVMREVQEVILGVLDQVTVADLCARASEFRSQAQGAAADYVI